MALRLKSATLNEPFEYISLRDDALDGEADDFDEAYQRFREGGPMPPIKEGMHPTIWTLRPMTDTRLIAKLSGILERDGYSAWYIGTAAVGVVSVTGCEDEDGKPFKLKRTRIGGWESLTHEVQDAIGAPLLIELGQAIITHKSPNQD